MQQRRNEREDEATPSANLEAERCLLSSVMQEPDRFDEVRLIVSSSMFAYSGHGLIWKALEAMDAAPDARGDLPSVGEQLGRMGLLSEVGGAAFLVEVYEAAPHGLFALHHAKIVLERWQRRELSYAGAKIQTTSQDTSRTPAEIAAAMGADLEKVIAPSVARSMVSAGEALARHFLAIQAGRQTGPHTGFSGIDEKEVVPRAGMLVVAARPGVGKTSFAANVALNMAKRGLASLFFSLEMPAEQLSERLLCAHGSFPAWAIRHPERADELTRERILYEMTKVSDLPIWIDDQSNRTVAQIAAAARVAKRRHDVGLIVVDYISLIATEDKRAPREQQVAQASRALREIGRTLEIPVMVLCQLNRLSENRPNKTPQLSDLRESGAIEQDADAVLLLHRAAVHDAEANPRDAACIVAKNRGGPTGTVKLDWVGDQMTFRDAVPSGFDDDQGSALFGENE